MSSASEAISTRLPDLTLYEYDGSQDKARPDLVVFPRSTADVAAIVRLAREYDMPIVGRGAGTGLSGGAIAVSGGIVIGFSRMNRILEVDLVNERAVVEPGVVNLDLTLAVQPLGYFYAPDPRASAPAPSAAMSPRMPAARTRSRTASRPTIRSASRLSCPTAPSSRPGARTRTAGYDLTGLLTGSEGTMALVTKVIVRLMRNPEAVKTILAIYDRRGCGRYGHRDHLTRHHPGCPRNARWSDAPHGRGGHSRRISDGCRGRAPD